MLICELLHIPSVGYWVSEFKYRGHRATLTGQLEGSFPWETFHDTPVLQGQFVHVGVHYTHMNVHQEATSISLYFVLSCVSH